MENLEKSGNFIFKSDSQGKVREFLLKNTRLKLGYNDLLLPINLFRIKKYPHGFIISVSQDGIRLHAII